jgi:hypothetical protein
LAFFDLPRGVRDQIYRHVLHDGAPDEPLLDDPTDPYVPASRLGLLGASRRVHNEAEAILYEIVWLGSSALNARRYLDFLGPPRIRKIRGLVLFYQCLGDCRTSHGPETSLNWEPVFDMLWHSWACIRRVEVHFREDYVRWHRIRNVDVSAGVDYLTDTCKLVWQEDIDSFWRGLRTLTMAQEIEFVGSVPEYFAWRHARELGWQMQGTVSGDSRDSRRPNTEFDGRLINPRFPDQFDWLLRQIHPRLEEGIDVSGLACSPGHVRYKDSTAFSNPHVKDTTTSLVAAPIRNHFFNLPIEIRQLIYEYASEWRERAYWPDRPKRWNTGVVLLSTCKQIAREALPSVYRQFKLHGCSALEDLGRVGRHLSHLRRLELHFTCFCPCSQDLAPHPQLSFTGTIHAHENPRYRRPQYAIEREHSHTAQARLQRYMDMWSDAMASIQGQPRIQDIEVTFASCCRYKPRIYRGQTAEEAARDQSRCLALESRFLDLLAGCRPAERFTLVGDVPPSLAVRLPLAIKSISCQMSDFIRGTEADRSAWDSGGHAFAHWTKSTPYPWTTYPTPRPVTHFVLVNERSPGSMWHLNVEPSGEKQEEKEKMLPRPGGLSAWSWEDLRNLADYNNDGDGLFVDD